MVFATLSHQVNFTSGGLTKIQGTLADPGSVLQDYVTTINNCTVTSSGLKKFQETLADPGSVLQEHVTTIDHCCPEEILKYYSPGYS